MKELLETPITLQAKVVIGIMAAITLVILCYYLEQYNKSRGRG